jgi:murein DD-endopeptidase MepM/ murein hydrolase activator NlpD
MLLQQPGGQIAEAAQPLHLPYPAGVAVNIIQGYNGGTHSGVERYSLDLVRSDGKTSGSPVLAPAAGTVAFAQLPGQEHGCIGVAMDDAGDFHYMLCHIILNHTYGYGDRISLGQQLGTVGSPGLVGNNGTSHVHMQLYILPGGQRTPVPFASPQGLTLESSSMPSDGTYDQWACSGAACHNLISRLPSSATNTIAADGVVPVTSAVTQPPAAGARLSVGTAAVVNGTSDCLRVHVQPALSADSIGCAPDGTVVFVSDGPKEADGHTWWFLRTLGWTVADYLLASGAAASTSSAEMQTDGAPAPHTSSAVLSTGISITVAGTGDCVRVHDGPSLDATVVNCLPDGATATLTDGPRSADGYTWWQLSSGGWAVSSYLEPPSR